MSLYEGGIRMQVGALRAPTCIRIPPYSSRTTPIRQYTPKQSSTPTYSRQLLRMNVITFGTCWAIKNLHKVTSSWFNLFNNIFCTDCNTDLHLIHTPTRSFFTKILPSGGDLYVLHRRLLCRWNEYWREIFSQSLCSQNTDGGKRSLKRWGRGRKIVLAGKTNDRRLYPAGARETSPSFHMTDCSNVHSHCFHFLRKIRARRRKMFQQSSKPSTRVSHHHHHHHHHERGRFRALRAVILNSIAFR